MHETSAPSLLSASSFWFASWWWHVSTDARPSWSVKGACCLRQAHARTKHSEPPNSAAATARDVASGGDARRCRFPSSLTALFACSSRHASFSARRPGIREARVAPRSWIVGARPCRKVGRVSMTCNPSETTCTTGNSGEETLAFQSLLENQSALCCFCSGHLPTRSSIAELFCVSWEVEQDCALAPCQTVNLHDCGLDLTSTLRNVEWSYKNSGHFVRALSSGWPGKESWALVSSSPLSKNCSTRFCGRREPPRIGVVSTMEVRMCSTKTISKTTHRLPNRSSVDALGWSHEAWRAAAVFLLLPHRKRFLRKLLLYTTSAEAWGWWPPLCKNRALPLSAHRRTGVHWKVFAKVCVRCFQTDLINVAGPYECVAMMTGGAHCGPDRAESPLPLRKECPPNESPCAQTSVTRSTRTRSVVRRLLYWGPLCSTRVAAPLMPWALPPFSFLPTRRSTSLAGRKRKVPQHCGGYQGEDEGGSDRRPLLKQPRSHWCWWSDLAASIRNEHRTTRGFDNGEVSLNECVDVWSVNNGVQGKGALRTFKKLKYAMSLRAGLDESLPHGFQRCGCIGGGPGFQGRSVLVVSANAEQWKLPQEFDILADYATQRLKHSSDPIPLSSFAIPLSLSLLSWCSPNTNTMVFTFCLSVCIFIFSLLRCTKPAQMVGSQATTFFV